MKKYRKPSLEQVLYVVETMLCEWGCHDHALEGHEMSSAWMFVHISIGECRAHHEWREVFWKKYKALKKEEKNGSTKIL